MNVINFILDYAIIDSVIILISVVVLAIAGVLAIKEQIKKRRKSMVVG